VIILRPIVAGDTLLGRNEVGDYAIAIPLGKVLRLETRQSNVVTSDLVIVAMGLGLAGIVACVASNC
jgi:NAD(P)H-flavin reductase